MKNDHKLRDARGLRGPDASRNRLLLRVQCAWVGIKSSELALSLLYMLMGHFSSLSVAPRSVL